MNALLRKAGTWVTGHAQAIVHMMDHHPVAQLLTRLLVLAAAAATVVMLLDSV